MARPTHCRYVTQAPQTKYFKPCGLPLRELQEVSISVEGLEALRLADEEGLTASDAAIFMRISRHTFGRLLTKTRTTVADALINGKALRIEGGTYKLLSPIPLSISKEKKMPIIAVSSDGPSIDDMVDPRFGRAGGFFVLNTQTMESSYIDNGESQCRSQGAGIETAERVCAMGVTAVLSGFVGPKAFAALTAAGIQIYQDLEDMTVREAIEKFTSGSISPADTSNKDRLDNMNN